jgi:hypothetical protein
MTFSFSSLLRLLVLLAVCATMFAVGVAKLHPPLPASRTLRPVHHYNINEYFLNNAVNRTPVWLNSETGFMTDHPLEDDDVLEGASCSPWSDEKNQFQVVGRWSTRTKDGPMSMSKDFGLARYTFPSGQMLDHISTETVPVGPPCWYPGTQARILFTAGDGSLYDFAFEPEPWATIPQAKPLRDLTPRPILWRCPKPGQGDVYLSDLSWPSDPRMGGCLVVSLREQAPSENGIPAFTRTSLWWLKLNFAGTEVVDLGELLVNDGSDKSDLSYDHRNPVVSALADGRLALAYLRQKCSDLGWEVRLAPIELDPETHIPRARVTESIALARKCQPAIPSFSSDGRWLNVITGPEAKDSRVARLPLTDLFHDSK